MRLLEVIIIVVFFLLSCEYVTDAEGEKQIGVVADSSVSKMEEERRSVKTLSLISFLDAPIDLQKYKKSKNNQYTTTSVSNKKDYYFQPKIENAIYYTYYYSSESVKDSKRIDQVIVFKHGENKHVYNDETEILIELRVFNNDSDLGEANLVGLTKGELESRFGSDYLLSNNRLIYSDKNKVLIIKLNGSKVKAYYYIKLNTEKLDANFIGQLIKQSQL
ncbi:hypothetical protein GCM10009118_21610 [Wandonia haliotis]|uniref:Lipoprotein n=1 Tax=Wandonia haliotis TaxID=574963 RepID=A0ABN1MR27_9FLAO